MKKIIAFLKMSNRYKHLIGGLMVGLLGFTPWTAFYAAAIAASCLELKDTLREVLGTGLIGGSPSRVAVYPFYFG